MGKDYIYTSSDDRLSLQERVDLLKNKASVEDDALLAAISILYAQNKNYIEAKESISKAIKINPLSPSYHLQLANYNAALYQNYEAYEEAKIAYELGAYDKKLEALIAKMAIETSDTTNGYKFIAAYYNANKLNPEAQLLMARMYLLKQDYFKAKNLAHNVLLKDSLNNTGLRVMYAVYKHLDSASLAINYGNQLLKTDSTNALYYAEIANLYVKENQNVKAAQYFVTSYQYKNSLVTLKAAIDSYKKLEAYDSIIFYTDSVFAGINYMNEYLLLNRAQAYDKRYKYDESYLVYNRLVKMDSTDSLVNAERAIVLKKIAYLQRKKREQKQLADSLAGSMPIIKF